MTKIIEIIKYFILKINTSSWYIAAGEIIFIITIMAFIINSFIKLFNIFYGEWQILRLFKDKNKTLLINKGFNCKQPNCSDWPQVYDAFIKSLSNKDKKAIERLLKKGILKDNPFNTYGAGLYSHLYLMSQLDKIQRDIV